MDDDDDTIFPKHSTLFLKEGEDVDDGERIFMKIQFSN